MIVTIRDVQEDEVEEVARLWLCMTTEVRPDLEPRLDWWVDITKRSLQSLDYKMLVADVDGGVVGFIDWWLLANPSDGKVHMTSQYMYLLPEYRDSGVARQLYLEAIFMAKEAGAQALELLCFEGEVEKWNKKGYKPTIFIMQKSL